MSGDPSHTAAPPTGGRPAVLVSNRQSQPVDEAGLAALAGDALIAEGLGAVELSLSFVDETEIEALHVRYMDEPGPTDVLSFPLDPSDVDEGGARMLGDVVVAPSVAARNNPADPAASSGCSSSTGSCTSSATTTRMTASAPRCGRARSATAGCAFRDLALGLRGRLRGDRLAARARRGVADAHEPRACSLAAGRGPSQRLDPRPRSRRTRPATSIRCTSA